MGIINKWKKKRKKWLDTHAQKSVCVKLGKNHGTSSRKTNRGLSVVIAPQDLSLTKNIEVAENTLQYFERVYREIEKSPVEQRIFLNLEHVEMFTVDAVMYLLAFILNNPLVKQKDLRLFGNMPKNVNAAKVLVKSGFLGYVKSDVPVFKDESAVKIISDDRTSKDLIKPVIVFAQNKINNAGKLLHTTLVELCGNVWYHAYTFPEKRDNTVEIESDGDRPRWYLYAEALESKVHFVFLDTGSGIPTTVHKKLREKLREMLPLVGMDHARLILSALEGNFRTSTRKTYRGKGLPEIRSNFGKNGLQNMVIVSNKGKCEFKDNEANARMINFNTPLRGTLYSWTME